MSLLDRKAPAPPALARLPFYYGWVNLVVASLAMSATMPGRSHGLSLITEPLLADLPLDRLTFGVINFWSILLGAAFCWPAGRLIDRFGARSVLVVVSLGLGAATVATAYATDVLWLFVALTFTRGLGQGALSVVSLALVGKWFRRRLGPAMGVFSMLLAIGFIAGVLTVQGAVQQVGWRAAWAGLGWVLILGMAPIGLLLGRSTPESCGLEVEGAAVPETAAGPDATLGTALRSPAFWAFTLGLALFNLTWSGLTQFSESIMNDHGFGGSVWLGGSEVRIFALVLSVLTATGLLSNLLAGWLAKRWPLGRVLLIGLLLLAGALAVFPWLDTVGHVMLWATVLGLSGGAIVVVFFAFYPQAFGRTNLGQVQGAAQVVSVLASASGTWVFAACREWTGSYDLVFHVAAPLAVVLALWAWYVPLPRSVSAMAIQREV